VEIEAQKRTQKIVGIAREWVEEVERTALAVVANYKSQRIAGDKERSSKGKGKKVPMPRVRLPGANAKRMRIYWNLYIPIKGQYVSHGKKAFTTDHLKKTGGKDAVDPYPEKVLARFCDDLDRDLVLQTERTLRGLERESDACRLILEKLQALLAASEPNE